MKHLKIFFVSILIISFQVNVISQDKPISLAEMEREQILNLTLDELLQMSMEELMVLSQKMGISIDELLKMKTSVASKTSLTPRETPGIISIITEEEIKKSGARDLIDIFRLVPGFDFGYDVQGVVSIGLRGNWVEEGKVLLLIDGQEMNENSYNNLPLGNHFPVDQITKIEIIRGTGSSVYGGTAELGVINIITKNGKNINGLAVSGLYGQMQNSMGRANLNLNAGKKLKNWDLSAKGFIGRANRSDQLLFKTFDDGNDTIDFSEGKSEIKSTHINLGAQNQKLSFRLIYDDYKTEYVYYDYDSLQSYSIFNEFRSLHGEIKYQYAVNDKLIITPKFQYKYSRPYYEEDYWRNFFINRYIGNISFNYAPIEKLNIVGGFEFIRDMGKCIETEGIFYNTNSRNLNLNNIAVFAEGILKVKKLNFIAGGRIENNSKYGWAGAPRIGITGVFNKFHFKSLVSGSFRSPSIGNIDTGKDIKPESALVTEIELGYRLNDHMFITTNFYGIKINGTIIYFDDGGLIAGENWGYLNAKSSGTDGFEIEFKSKYAKGFGAISYSYNTFAFKSIPDAYKVPDQKDKVLGFSPQKLALYGSYYPIKKLFISPSVSISNKRYGYTKLDTDGNPVVSVFDMYTLINLTVGYENLFVKGLNCSISAFDLLNQKPQFLQPYNGYTPPYPGRSRELLLKLTFQID